MIQREGVRTGIEGEIFHPIATCQGAAEGADSREDGVVITGSEVDVADVGEGRTFCRARIRPSDNNDVAIAIEGEAVDLWTTAASAAITAALDVLESRIAATTANGDCAIITVVNRE